MQLTTILQTLLFASTAIAQASSSNIASTRQTSGIGLREDTTNSANTKITNRTTYSLKTTINGKKLTLDPFRNIVFIGSGIEVYCPTKKSCANFTNTFETVYVNFNFGSIRGALAMNTSVATGPYLPGIPQEQIYVDETGALRWTSPDQTYTISSSYTGFHVKKGVGKAPDTLIFTGNVDEGGLYKAGPFMRCPIPAFGVDKEYYSVYIKTAKFNQVGCVEFSPEITYSNLGVYEYL